MGQRVAVRRGDLVSFTVDKDIEIEPAKLVGFERFVPRNKFKEAFIKALKKAYQNNDRMYRRFNDLEDTVQFGLFAEEKTEDNIDIRKEMVVTLDKLTGEISFPDSLNGRQQEIKDQILGAYESGKLVLDAAQLRSLVMKVVKRECYGVPIKKGSGVYFIDKRFDSLRSKIEELFDLFGNGASVMSFHIYDDLGALDAIEHAAQEDILADVDAMMAEIEESLKAGTMTTKKIENRIDDAQEILQKVAVHEHNLRTRATEFTNKVQAIKEKLVAVSSKADSLTIDFLDELTSL